MLARRRYPPHPDSEYPSSPQAKASGWPIIYLKKLEIAEQKKIPRHSLLINIIPIFMSFFQLQ